MASTTSEDRMRIVDVLLLCTCYVKFDSLLDLPRNIYKLCTYALYVEVVAAAETENVLLLVYHSSEYSLESKC